MVQGKINALEPLEDAKIHKNYLEGTGKMMRKGMY